MFNNKFKNKKILVTGHTGFKGSWLSMMLLELGAEVVGYALEPETEPNLFTELKLEKRLKNNFGDIRDYEKLLNVIKTEKPEIIFHMAAQPLVRRSYREPVLTYETNVMGTVNLLEACRINNSVKTVINITTDKCYENKEWVYSYREVDRLGGYDPYSASKACAELVASSYRNSFFNTKDYGKTHNLALASVRAGNVIGGGDWSEDRLVPDCIKALSQNQSIQIRNPNSIRPWQHVLEPLTGYLTLAAHMSDQPMEYAEGWNFGPNEDAAINVGDLSSKLIQCWGSGSVNIDEGPHPHEANFLKLDISKAASKLNFKPCLNIDETLSLTVNWYKNFYNNKEKISDFTKSQIQYYLEKQSKVICSKTHLEI